jgi:hypothetical protein
MIDPVTKKTVYIAPDGYDASQDDDVHKSTDVMPSASVNVTNTAGSNAYVVNVAVTPGTFAITDVQISIGGKVVATLPAGSSNIYTYDGTVTTKDNNQPVSVTITDNGYYTGTASGGSTPKYTSSP